MKPLFYLFALGFTLIACSSVSGLWEKAPDPPQTVTDAIDKGQEAFSLGQGLVDQIRTISEKDAEDISRFLSTQALDFTQDQIDELIPDVENAIEKTVPGFGEIITPIIEAELRDAVDDLLSPNSSPDTIADQYAILAAERAAREATRLFIENSPIEVSEQAVREVAEVAAKIAVYRVVWNLAKRYPNIQAYLIIDSVLEKFAQEKLGPIVSDTLSSFRAIQIQANGDIAGPIAVVITPPPDRLRCRKEPGLNSEIIEWIHPGKQVTIIESVNPVRQDEHNWNKVMSSNRKQCWVANEFLSITK